MTGSLIFLVPGLPAFVALLWASGLLRGAALSTVAPWAALPALALGLHPGAVGTAAGAGGLLLGLELELDAVGRAFLLLTGFLWLAVGVYARAYHADDRRRGGFFGFFAITMTGNLGLIVAADLLSFYFFFAVMTFAAYVLVVHHRGDEAMRAGKVYVVMAVLGELAILGGLFALGRAAGGVASFGPELTEAWAVLGEEGRRGRVATLLTAGFAVKAGLVPAHLWLPLAHPVAPTAASALLSGTMIKAGLLAWLRFLPLEAALPLLGAGLVFAGVVAAFYGVLVGLAQDDAKTVLAYSSVSQMGYMSIGTGILVWAPEWGGAVLFAVVFHALHHGVAKAGLFLAVGVADGGGGRWPASVLAVGALLALVLAGAPLTSGARAKNVLKGALETAGGPWYATLDPLLLAAAGGTALLMARFLVTLDLRMGSSGASRAPSVATAEHPGGPPWGLVLPWALVVAASLTAPLWLGFGFPAPAGVDVPGAFEGAIEALVPLFVGGAAAWVVWRRPGILGRVRGVRVPPGDLVVVVEGAWRRVRTSARGLLGVPGRAARRVARFGELEALGGREGSAADLPLASGPVLGVLFLAVGILLLLFLV